MRITQKISPFLWFNDNAEEAAKFYVSVFPNSRILNTVRNGQGGPSQAGKPGAVLVVFFEIAGQQFTALNGGPQFTFDEAVSFVVACDTQAEIDMYWEKLTAKGGTPVQCGWLKDRFGLSWQIVPAALPEFFKDPKTTDRVMQAVIQMVKLDIAKMKAAAEGR